MPDIASLIDDFSDGVINNPPWGDSGNGASESGGAMSLPCVPSFGFANTITQDYDLTNGGAGSGVFTEISDVPAAGVGVTSQGLLALRSAETDAGSLRIGFDQGNMVGQYVLSGPTFVTVFSVAYSAVTHRWWRITEASGTVTYWTSPDGTTWTNQGTADVAADLDFGVTLLDVHYFSGQFGGPEETLGQLVVERVNLGPNDHAGGSVATVTVTADGAGSPALSGGSVATVTVTADGAGVVGTDFPNTPLPLTVELFHSDQWNVITTDVYHRDAIRVIEGRPDEAAVSEPSRMSLTLNNRNGKYSPRNPASPLYGLIGRNTPVRVRLGQPALGGGLVTPGNSRSYISAPHASGDDITGDIDIRIELEFDEWPPQATGGTNTTGLARRYVAVDDNRAWVLEVVNDLPGGSPAGTLALVWSPDGAAFQLRTSTAQINPTGPIALRATLDVDNGAGGNTTTFYTADSINGPWVQLGVPVTEAGTSGLFAATADLELGRANGAGDDGFIGDPFYGTLRAFELRDGIDGTVINSIDLADVSLQPGTRDLTSPQGDQWRVLGGAHFTDASVLFSGEVSAWPPRWEVTGNDVWVSIQASGIGRRLQQGRKALDSAVRRGIPGAATVVGYWPCEEGRDATRLASAFDGHPSGSLFGEVTLGSYDGFRASAPIPEWGAGGRLHLFVPEYPADDNQLFTCLVHVAENGVATETRLVALVTTGSVKRWEIMLSAAGSLRMRAYDATETLVLDDSFVGFAVNGTDRVLSFRLRQQGGDIEAGIFTYNLATGIITFTTETVVGHTYGRIAKIYTAREGDDLAGTAIGHLIVSSPHVAGSPDNLFLTTARLVAGHNGETAADRLDRLATEEGVPTVVLLGPDLTEPMGTQTQDRLVELLQQTAASDLAVYGDARDQLAVSWRSRHSLYTQPAALTLDYAQGQIARGFEPQEDDRLIRNDITVERIDGSERRAVATTGPLSSADPPAGVGRYDEQVSLSLASDGQLDHQAAWRLHLGTHDGLRYPVVRVAVHRNPLLLDTVNAVKIGDRIVLTNLPAWLPPGDASLLVNRIRREMLAFEYFVEFVCSPADPWAVALSGLTSPTDAGPTDRARADTAGSELAAGVDATATALSVATTIGPVWTTDASDLPFDVLVGGEVMRVTAISGASSPQTMTVVRSVNGIVKAHSAGVAVALAYPAVAAL